MTTTFEFWASGSSTLATSAAVKVDSTLPARANQVRFDTNEHANYFFGRHEAPPPLCFALFPFFSSSRCPQRVPRSFTLRHVPSAPPTVLPAGVVGWDRLMIDLGHRAGT